MDKQQINDGGPVYPRLLEVTPTENGGTEFRSEMGMTMRDWFAGQMIIGIWANESTLNTVGALSESDEQGVTATAKMAYRMADELIAAREVKP